jgi:ADP-heptose:LPS heptosyltransferase
MKVDTMRFVDKWAGIPLTFLFSIFLWLYEKILLIKAKKPDIHRTLFIELSEMGSAILVDPAMRKLRSKGNADLYFAIFLENYKSLKILNTVPEEQIFKMRSDNLFQLGVDVLKFILWCRKKRISTVIDLELFSRFTALLSGLSGAKARIGFTTFHDEGMYRGNIINHPVRYNPHVHISVNFISLVNTALGFHNNPYTTTPVQPDEIKLEMATIDSMELDKVRIKIREIFPRYTNQQIVILNVNASDMLPQRRWLPEYFEKVGRCLLSRFPDILIVATGSPDEKEYVEKVVKNINHERCVNSAGIFKFNELIPLYSLSTAMLTNDSGPAHFASVTPLKIFVIFGPETPKLYGPLGDAESIYLGLPCSPCVSAANHRKTTCQPRPCITGIPPKMVEEKMIAYLNTVIP